MSFAPSGVASAISRSIGVSVGPGHTLLAVTPARATSRASVLVNAITPPFAPAYTASPEEPTRPASEPMFTTRPHPRPTISGTTARVTRRHPL